MAANRGSRRANRCTQGLQLWAQLLLTCFVVVQSKTASGAPHKPLQHAGQPYNGQRYVIIDKEIRRRHSVCEQTPHIADTCQAGGIDPDNCIMQCALFPSRSVLCHWTVNRPTHERAIRHCRCVSEPCYAEVYHAEALEDGEIDQPRANLFKACVRQEIRAEKEANRSGSHALSTPLPR